MRAMPFKWNAVAAVLVPCVFGWCAEVLLVFGFFRLIDLDLNLTAQIALAAVGLTYLPTCAAIMGVINSLCLPSSIFDLEHRDMLANVCLWLFFGIPLLPVLGVLAWSFGTFGEFIKMVPELLGPVTMLVICFILPFVLIFSLCFNWGRNLGAKYTLPIFLGLTNEWEKEE